MPKIDLAVFGSQTEAIWSIGPHRNPSPPLGTASISILHWNIWAIGDAETFYNDGVRLSFDYWELSQDVNAYLSQTGVAYDGRLETIMTQKWLASFLVGLEAWYDFRRTGLPSAIVPGPDNVNNDVVPVRFLYPDSEQTLNAENYKAAVSALGENTINAKGWWESN